MKDSRLIMGMPVTIEIVGTDKADANRKISSTLEDAFNYFTYVDETFSTFKKDSEIMNINRGEIKLENASPDMREIFKLAEQTKNETNGYFYIVNRDGVYDPSGIVKGWAINNTAKLIKNAGFSNYYVDAGGDIEVGGHNSDGDKWSIGIRNPLNQDGNVKIVHLSDCGIATSGTYVRGQHIYNPHDMREEFSDIVSLSVIGPNIYEADRFATAAFAMGRKGIRFIENSNVTGKPRKFEGYMIDSKGIATMTSGFSDFVKKTANVSEETSTGDS